MRRTRRVVLPMRSWQYMGLMVVSLAYLTLGLGSLDREGKSGSLAGSELKHTAPHEEETCPNVHSFIWPPYDETALQKDKSNEPGHDVRTSVRSRLSRDSKSAKVNDRVSRARSLDRHAKLISMSGDRKIDARDRRSISTDEHGRTRKIGMSLVRDDRSNRHTLTRSRSFELRENPGSESRENRIEVKNRQSRNTDRRARVIGTPSVRDVGEERQRLISRSQDRRSSNKVIRSRSYERRSVEDRTDVADRRNRRNSDLLRRTDQSVSERDRRDDRFVLMSRSDSHIENRGQRSVEGLRLNARDRQQRHNNVLVGSRWIDDSRRDVRRMNVHLEERRSTEQRAMDSMKRQSKRAVRLVRSRSEDVVQEDVRGSGTRSQERRSSDRQTISEVERQERRTSVQARSLDVRPSRSHDVRRVDIRREAVRSEARRSSKRREITPVEHPERRTNVLTRSHDVRLSPSRDVNRVDVRRERVRSNERRSSKRREITPVEHPERRTNVLTRSHDARLSPSRDVNRVDVRRERVRSDERRSSERREITPVEHPERRTNVLTRSHDVRLSPSRDVNRVDVRRERVRSDERRSSERREITPVEHPEKRTNVLTRSHDARLSPSRDVNRVDVRRERVRSDERRSSERRETNPDEHQERRINILAKSRDVQRLQSRDISRVNVRRVEERSEERRSPERRETNSVERLERRVSLLARSKSRNVNRLDVRRMGSPLQAWRSIEQLNRNVVKRQERRMDLLATSRNVQQSRSRYVDRLGERSWQRRSVEKEVGRTSWVNSLRRNVPTSRNSDIRDFERRERLAARNASQECRERFVEHDIHRERRTSRATDRVDVREKHTGTSNGIGTYRMEKNLKVRNERHQMNYMNVPKLEDVRKLYNTELCDYLRQALILALCALYGASLFKGKGDSYRNIFTKPGRLVPWS